MNTIKLTPTQKKYLQILQLGIIGKRDIIAMRSFMGKSKENAQFVFDNMPEDGLTLSDSQNKKGIDFLLNQWKTPTGKERLNNPFGYREQNVLEGFTHFTLSSFYDASRYGQAAYYLPIYHCFGNDSCFEYYYNGKVNIIG